MSRPGSVDTIVNLGGPTDVWHLEALYDRFMPRYLIERTYTVDLDTLPTVATRSKAIGYHRFPEIVWEHSHVVVDSEGTPKSFCIYAAPSEEMVREHSKQLGDHFVEEVYEIAGDVTPDDFPLTDDPT